MNKKKLLEAIQIIVKKEVDKRVNERVNIIKKQMLREVKSLLKEYDESHSKKESNEEVDPFKQATQMLEHNRTQEVDQPQKEQTQETTSNKEQTVFSKDPVLNEVLSQTQPFTPSERNGTAGAQGGKSVLDNLPSMQDDSQMINEASGNSEDMEEWPTMNHNMQPQPTRGMETGTSGAEQIKQNMRAQMEAELGVKGRPNKSGLGVNTGLKGLDRILNRDNSELVKAFNKKGNK